MQKNDGRTIIQINGKKIAFDEVYLDAELCTENKYTVDLDEYIKENFTEIEKNTERHLHFTNNTITDLSQARG